ncbi:MAG TPA: hypothetical protein ENK25_08155 [Bacteroidetes bacterium]|nr:hypothetical protein [Bacteroidota bacterium]
MYKKILLILFSFFVLNVSAQYICVPEKVTRVGNPVLSLNGTWKFNPVFSNRFSGQVPDTKTWKDICVPGEWKMQGSHVRPGQPAAYARMFVLPTDRKGKKVMLCCDAIFCRAGEY